MSIAKTATTLANFSLQTPRGCDNSHAKAAIDCLSEMLGSGNRWHACGVPGLRAAHTCSPELLRKMSVVLTEIQIASDYDHEGRLILIDGRLVAVMVKLSELHEHLAGRWYLETGYGVLKYERPSFLDLDSAVEWIQYRLAGDPLIGKSVFS